MDLTEKKPPSRSMAKLAVASIKVGCDRARGLREDAVDRLVGSMRESGLLCPILVSSDHRLIAGLHRLEAAKRLGWSKIDAYLVDFDDLHCQLAEIDENLVRADLSALEHAEHMARRKELYLALHPETANPNQKGGPGRGNKTTPDSGAVSFVADTAAKTGAAESTVRESVQIATSIPEAVKEAIRGTPVEDRKTDLLKLAKMEPAEQKAVGEAIAAGAKTFAEAVAALPDAPEKPRKEKAKRSEANTLADCEHAIDVAIDAAKEAYPSLRGAIAAHLRLLIKELTQ